MSPLPEMGESKILTISSKKVSQHRVVQPISPYSNFIERSAGKPPLSLIFHCFMATNHNFRWTHRIHSFSTFTFLAAEQN